MQPGVAACYTTGAVVLQGVVRVTPVLWCVTLPVYLDVKARGLTEKMVRLFAPDLWSRKSPQPKAG